ncbi:NADP-dependent oxidoreductase domain-containing protein [Mycena alexandri]|uniref:NADP-dependent oxidoreductase domain-containing protein n=1 Tax=Mycena alexandri TaxID=1745969 RepID=A0AAD6SGW7_9AGAR|nr:NADP-dependent oxidoreductase domain-containing protein [Mycena alexandri]KAJ7042766.1 NADP-dependent oxidoreductase domain-containing protein [Mycena alexandri]
MTNSYPTKQLGQNGPWVSAIGLGAGGISGAFYGKADRTEIFKMLSYAADRGVSFWDTADYYGDSEEIIGEWFAKTGRRSDIFLASKFGAADLREGPNKGKTCSEPSYIKQALQRSLKLLQTDHIDLYYQHRVDPAVPIEIVLETLRPFVESGQVKWLGLSECSASTLRRAKAVPGVGEKVVAVQMEYSPFELSIETTGLLEAAKELGVGIVAYSPLGRGLITGRYQSPDDLDDDDVRRLLPRFSRENFPKNLALADHFKTMSEKYQASTSQIVLAWIVAQGFIPVPGTRVVARLEENAHGAEITLSREDVQVLRKYVEEADVHGARHITLPQGDCIKLADWKN